MMAVGVAMCGTLRGSGHAVAGWGRVVSNGLDDDPERRAAQLSRALRLLRAPDVEARALREACGVILALSADPFDWILAREVLGQLNDAPPG